MGAHKMNRNKCWRHKSILVHHDWLNWLSSFSYTLELHFCFLFENIRNENYSKVTDILQYFSLVIKMFFRVIFFITTSSDENKTTVKSNDQKTFYQKFSHSIFGNSILNICFAYKRAFNIASP